MRCNCRVEWSGSTLEDHEPGCPWRDPYLDEDDEPRVVWYAWGSVSTDFAGNVKLEGDFASGGLRNHIFP